MINRREVLSSLASLPLVGFLFGCSEKKKEKRNEYALTPTSLENVEPVHLSGGKLLPSIHIPHEDGMMTAIPLPDNFIVYGWDKTNEDGPTPVKPIARYVNGKLSFYEETELDGEFISREKV